MIQKERSSQWFVILGEGEVPEVGDPENWDSPVIPPACWVYVGSSPWSSSPELQLNIQAPGDVAKRRERLANRERSASWLYPIETWRCSKTARYIHMRSVIEHHHPQSLYEWIKTMISSNIGCHHGSELLRSHRALRPFAPSMQFVV